MIAQAYEFRMEGEPVSYAPYGNGHINRTYLLSGSTGRQYILQQINRTVFRDPESLSKNLSAVTAHLRKTAEDPWQVLTPIPTKAGGEWLVDEQGEYWRLFHFIKDSVCLDTADTPEIFRESAVAFGQFQRQLADFPAQTLVETIPHFHDTPMRYSALHTAIESDDCGRAESVRAEIEFALEREPYAATLTNLQASGDLPIRVTHNDTKLNNVIFDANTRKAICVIDLDTVMPGLSVNDYGDSIRFGASFAEEDEPDLSKVNLVFPYFAAYTDGFLSACGGSLCECEALHLRDGAKMMTLECGTRFLTDYLSGDTYFHINYESQNLDRCRTQYKLVRDMEARWDEMQESIMRIYGVYKQG